MSPWKPPARPPPGALLPLLFLLGCAGSPAPPAPPPPPHAPLRAEAPRIAADVAWLADDAREGRRAGTPGELAAARYLAQRLAALGLEAAGEDGWFQEFRVPLPARDGGGSSVSWGDRRVDDPARVVPLSCAEAGAAGGTLSFCGYGIDDDGLGRHDFDPAAAGGIALIVRGVPPQAPTTTGDDDGKGSWGNAGSLFLKVMNAKRRGFSGVIVAQHPASTDEPLPPFDPGRGARAGIPALAVSADVAEALLPGGYGRRVARVDLGQDSGGGGDSPGVEVEIGADVVRAASVARNVLGRVRGRRPGRAVVVGAHFDHLGRGGTGSLAPDALGQIHNGADDNASGSACVLELARLVAGGPAPEGDVVFALWSGEELGLLGSEHWTSHPTVPLDGVVANLNLDMVGRAADGVLHVLGAGTSPAFEGWMEEAGSRAGLRLKVSLSGQGLGGSDHQVFLRREIPALHLFSGVHTDYHRPSDDYERFEADGARRVVELSLDLLVHMQGEDDLAYVEPEVDLEASEQRERGWGVTFGSVPEYGHEGKGLLLAGTSPGSPAERAGLLGGDVIVGIDDIGIETIYDFVYMLQVHKPGDVVLTRFLRDGEEHEVLVTLASRAAE